MTDTLNSLLNTGGPSFKFDKVGDSIRGVLVKAEEQQATEWKTKKPKYWDNGKPVMQLVLTIRTDDGEETRVFLKHTARLALIAAVDGRDFQIGGRVGFKRIEDTPSKDGGDPRHEFEAAYEPPTKNVSASDLLGD